VCSRCSITTIILKQKGSYAPAKLNGKIQFDHVWFAYTADRYVLKDIHFTIQPGETVAIVGHTGSGKTSIISLLNGCTIYRKALSK